MGLFKKRIPKQDVQEVTELESWTVKWEVKEGWSNNTLVYFKTFIKEEDVKTFKEELQGCAKFIGAWIKVESYKN